jgi:hypothetical protein
MTDLMAGELITIALLALAVIYLINRLVRDTQPPDIADCGMAFDGPCCDRGCDECGAPMVIDEPTTVLTEQALRDAWEGVYADYGTNVVHRHCLNARRDGRTACADCARVMVGAAS